jgi:hypothetical protein
MNAMIEPASGLMCWTPWKTFLAVWIEPRLRRHLICRATGLPSEREVARLLVRHGEGQLAYHFSIRRRTCLRRPELAIRLTKAFGSTAEAWLGMQLAYDLAAARKNEDHIKINRQRVADLQAY